MNLLCWHCDSLSYRDKKPSTRPSGISQVIGPPGSGSFEDVLAVFVCAETSDGDDQIARASAIISEIAHDIGRNHVVLVPFVHLSNTLAEPRKAVLLIGHLKHSLAERGMKVDALSFGYHKHFELQGFKAKAHERSVAYREIQ